MKTFDSISGISRFLHTAKKQGKTIGFVATMGALHRGHLTLMQKAKNENDILVVSVFVNPLQFNNPEDLEKYPRNIEHDRMLLEEVGCDVLFNPGVKEMYPEPGSTQYDFGLLEKVMEGPSRPGHFNGVAVVVKKLFDIIRPDKAYFGEKDFQQLAIIQKLVKMENLPVQIVPCPIVRENDGLAMSSRNERLTAGKRQIAPFVYQTLKEAAKKSSTMTPDEVRLFVRNRFKDEPDFQLEYFEIADDRELQPVSNWNEAGGILGFVAASLENVRLIDNMRII
ncbi:MAG TPA: pantoate--beta-alanine ligase [Bacteroidetes bacterium]|nr:pantoate--beta-alanine ligase [Bacteroidota bacterium]